MIINDIEYESIFRFALNNTFLVFIFVIPIFLIISLFFYFKNKEKKNFNIKEFIKSKIIIFILLFCTFYLASLSNILLKDLESTSFEKIELIEENVFDIESISKDVLKLTYKNNKDVFFIYINEITFKDFKINNETYQNTVIKGTYKGAKLFNFKDCNLFFNINKNESTYYIDEESYYEIKKILDSKYIYKREN